MTAPPATGDGATSPVGARRLARWLVTRIASIPWIPVVVSVFAIRALLYRAELPLGSYDEGLLLTDAFLMNNGRVIYRDFYANYPPGVFQIVRAVLALGLPPVWTVRLLGFGVRVGSALAAGSLVRKARGERGLCVWTVATTLVLQEQLGLALFAYPVAVLFALAALLTWPTSHSAALASIVGGVLLGLVSYFRHDLFLFVALGLSSLEAISWLLRRRSFFTDSWVQLRRLATAVLATVAVLWLPVLVRSGLSRSLHDLVLDQARLTMPGRLLPIPPLFDPIRIEALDTTLPSLFVDHTRIGVVLIVAGAVASAVVFLWRLRGDRQRESPRTRLMALIAISALAVLPQALQRTDYWHVAFCIPLAIPALVAALRARAGVVQLLLLVALLPWFTGSVRFADLDGIRRVWSNRSDAWFITPARQAIVDFVARETRPDEPLFVGCASHRRTIFNSIDILYLARRTNATRYVQFDPGTVTSAEGQREMIADLERTRPRLALRDPICAWDEPNRSRVPGATELDAYLLEHYQQDGVVGGLAVWRRRTPDPQRAHDATPVERLQVGPN